MRHINQILCKWMINQGKYPCRMVILQRKTKSYVRIIKFLLKFFELCGVFTFMNSQPRNTREMKHYGRHYSFFQKYLIKWTHIDKFSFYQESGCWQWSLRTSFCPSSFFVGQPIYHKFVDRTLYNHLKSRAMISNLQGTICSSNPLLSTYCSMKQVTQVREWSKLPLLSAFPARKQIH